MDTQIQKTGTWPWDAAHYSCSNPLAVLEEPPCTVLDSDPKITLTLSLKLLRVEDLKLQVIFKSFWTHSSSLIVLPSHICLVFGEQIRTPRCESLAQRVATEKSNSTALIFLPPSYSPQWSQEEIRDHNQHNFPKPYFPNSLYFSEWLERSGLESFFSKLL